MCRCILHFRCGKARLGSLIGEVVQREGVNLRNTSTEKAADEEFEAFKFRLQYDETEIGLWVCVASLLFNKLDLKQASELFPRRKK